LTVTTAQYKEKLRKSKTPLDLNYPYQTKIYEIFRELLRYQGPKQRFKPTRFFEERRRYLPDDYKKRVGRQFFYAAKEWLLDREYIKKGYKVTEKGNKAFLSLYELLNPKNKESLELTICLEKESSVECFIEGTNHNAFDNIELLATPEVLEKIAQLLYSLLLHSPLNNLQISIKENGHRDPESGVVKLLRIMHMVQNYIIHNELQKSAREIRETNATSEEWIESTYIEVWKALAHDFIYKKETKQPIAIHQYHSYIRPAMIRLIKENNEVKMWIERQLDQNPNFFMPHVFWTYLGLKPRPDIKNSLDAKLPSYTTIISWSGLEEIIVKLGDFLEFIKDLKEDERVVLFYIYLIDHQYYRLTNFYEAWNILRNSYKESLPVISRILNVSRECFILDQKPSVDLDRVFSEWGGNEKEIDLIIEDIRSGKYSLKS